MSGSRNALYRAICASPDEDTPRLAFADLVEEEGDVLYAAFIRGQIALARVPPDDPLFITSRLTNPGALNGHGMTGLLPKPLPDGYSWHAFEFRRGFPWKVGVQSAAAFDADGAIFATAPIEALSITPRGRPDVDAITDWPHLTRVQRLEFTLSRFDAFDAHRLGKSEHAAKLTELAFDFDGITAEGLEALARSPLFPRLTALDLRSNTMPPALLADAIGAIRTPSALAHLSLAANHITAFDAQHLFALPVMQGLRHLDLSDNPRLGVAGVEALAESGITRGLRALDLEGTHPGIPGLRALTKTGLLAGLRILNLAANRLGPNAVKLLGGPDATRGLRVLNLSENPIGDAGATALADTPAVASLLDLDLADTGLTDRGLLALAESRYLQGLLRLNLTTTRKRAPIGPHAQRALTERFGNRVLL
jgi:uncharacterized protein (TIGR02996 family)